MSINGIGTDIVSKKRIENTRVEEKFLNDDEKLILSEISDEEKINFISGRWVAKEAIIKASDKKILFSSISVLKSATGKPIIMIDNELRNDIHISISHEKEYSIAFCVIEK